MSDSAIVECRVSQGEGAGGGGGGGGGASSSSGGGGAASGGTIILWREHEPTKNVPFAQAASSPSTPASIRTWTRK
jgi:hypothetical protein